MKRSIFLFSMFYCLQGSAQNQKNYILEINGDTVSLSLDDALSFKTKNGQTLNIKLRQKEVLSFTDETISFQYPATFSITTKKIDDVEQILCMSGGGNGFLIQKYKDINPENMVDLLLDEMTSESIDAGYKETKAAVEKKLSSGKVINGKESKLVLDDETNIYTVYPVKIRKGGIVIVLLVIDPSDEKEMAAIETFWKTLETKN